jgi:hypothetical protein
MMWSSNKSMGMEQKWATSFSVLVMLILVVDKMIESADLYCQSRVHMHNHEAVAEQRAFEDLVRLTQRELFERCKEIFHSSFKTRKGGKEACNPIRDGLGAFRGRDVPQGISRLVWDVKAAHREFRKSFHRMSQIFAVCDTDCADGRYGRVGHQVALDDAGEHRRRGIWQRWTAGVGVPSGLH